jgi:6-phosphogluconolactonase
MGSRRLLLARSGPQGGVDLLDPAGAGVLDTVFAPDASFLLGAEVDGLVHVLRGGEDDGELITLRVEGDRLTAVDARPTHGGEPCHAAVVGGDSLVVANYAGGSLAVFTLDPDGVPSAGPELIALDGSGPVLDRQEAAHPHFVLPGVAGHDALVVDLGADVVWALDRGRRGWSVREFARAAPGAGPRHAVVAGGSLLVTAELSGEVLRIALDGTLTAAVPATALAGTGPAYPGDVMVVDTAAVVAVRGRSSVTVVTFDEGDGLLAEREIVVPGSWPQQFLRHEGHVVMVDRDGGRIVRIEPATGEWSVVVDQLAAPAWALAVEAGR